jgi:hypothetical protein
VARARGIGDVCDIQERRSLQADVDKRGILASNDIIDTAFEDTANDTLTAFDV